MIRRLCVFTGSTRGADPALVESAEEIGRDLARRGIGLVYGAGGAGLMGAVAEGAMSEGGEVIGVIPRFMVTREWGRDDLTEVHVVQTMHQRKAMMADLSDAFLALPGGLGTLEEIFEVWTWRQIGLMDKPLGFLDLPTQTGEGFWQPLLTALRGLVDAGFVSQASLDAIVVAPTLDEALTRFAERGTSPALLRPGS
ncbi:TIGR00730 family Rossman fold protein [Janibacter sp. GXQ6167]|uniref:LOG family protein n=1 Tax=Janibacter sp. GXQ6167 TaxID=3240791 RepID=UPI0035238856